MDKKPGKGRKHEPEKHIDRDEATRRTTDEARHDAELFNPRTGEDPGLLELTEDPRERRLKRHTM